MSNFLCFIIRLPVHIDATTKISCNVRHGLQYHAYSSNISLTSSPPEEVSQETKLKIENFMTYTENHKMDNNLNFTSP